MIRITKLAAGKADFALAGIRWQVNLGWLGRIGAFSSAHAHEPLRRQYWMRESFR
jgi:hypothetical protein